MTPRRLVQDQKLAFALADHKDLPEVQQLAGVIWRQHYRGIISDEQIEYMLECMHSIPVLASFVSEIRRGRGMILARFNRALIGFAAYYPIANRGETKLDKLYVHPDYHGLGLGHALLWHVEHIARSYRRHTLILNVNRNNSKPIAFYKRNGFVVRTAEVKDIGGGFVMDDYVMAKSL